MAISRVSSATAEANSITIPSHQAGDLILLLTYRHTNTAAISKLAGWDRLQSRNAGSRFSAMNARIAKSNAETSGTWSNAELIGVVVYRDDSVFLSPGNVLVGGANTTNVPYATTFLRGDSSWFAGFVCLHLNSTTGDAAPPGMTNFANLVGASAGEIAMHDTADYVTSAFGASVTADAAVTSHTYVVEIHSTGISKSGGASFPLIGPGGLVF